ncbi:universal stress protein [Agilicoccus flavus]|uniref:universal stress protein n=1 Tax=Agilicoccus flavus TaxID=2775968 RepID=UPI001CF613A2|nr:universal stress protein [Agilicoccus flavus]
MTVMVAVPDSEEGVRALEAAIAEAGERGTGLVVVNLTLGEIDLADVPEGMACELVGRKGRTDRDPADTVLHALSAHPDVDRLVIGVARRSPVGKLLLGSLSQRLILEADVPVLAVKLTAH